jgi:hypothetical protein
LTNDFLRFRIELILYLHCVFFNIMLKNAFFAASIALSMSSFSAFANDFASANYEIPFEDEKTLSDLNSNNNSGNFLVATGANLETISSLQSRLSAVLEKEAKILDNHNVLVDYGNGAEGPRDGIPTVIQWITDFALNSTPIADSFSTQLKYSGYSILDNTSKETSGILNLNLNPNSGSVLGSYSISQLTGNLDGYLANAVFSGDVTGGLKGIFMGGAYKEEGKDLVAGFLTAEETSNPNILHLGNFANDNYDSLHSDTTSGNSIPVLTDKFSADIDFGATVVENAMFRGRVDGSATLNFDPNAASFDGNYSINNIDPNAANLTGDLKGDLLNNASKFTGDVSGDLSGTFQGVFYTSNSSIGLHGYFDTTDSLNPAISYYGQISSTSNN